MLSGRVGRALTRAGGKRLCTLSMRQSAPVATVSFSCCSHGPARTERRAVVGTDAGSTCWGRQLRARHSAVWRTGGGRVSWPQSHVSMAHRMFRASPPVYSNSDDHYKVLGVSPKASPDEIKKAYRRKAILWHPDRNQDQAEAAVAKFKEVGDAYGILSNSTKRRAYDLERSHVYTQSNKGDIFADFDFDVVMDESEEFDDFVEFDFDKVTGFEDVQAILEEAEAGLWMNQRYENEPQNFSYNHEMFYEMVDGVIRPVSRHRAHERSYAQVETQTSTTKSKKKKKKKDPSTFLKQVKNRIRKQKKKKKSGPGGNFQR